MYLREMGSVELLSREGEIAIAKRIEAGREAMIAGLCESPLTFQAIIIWRDELNEGKILLRDIIDLEATYQGPDAKPAPSQPLPGEALATGAASPAATATASRNPRAAPKQADERGGGQEPRARRIRRGRRRSGEFAVARRHGGRAEAARCSRPSTGRHQLKKLRKLQDQVVERALKNDQLSSGQEKRYRCSKDEIVAEIKSLSLNNNRIESLVETLYDINKKLIGYEGRLLRLAESYGVQRARTSSSEYQGAELDPTGSAASAA